MCKGCQCTTLASQLLLFLASKTARRSATSAALRRRPTLVLRDHPGVPPWLPHDGFANGEEGFGELLLPGAVLRQVYPLGEHRREIEVVQVALE